MDSFYSVFNVLISVSMYFSIRSSVSESSTVFNDLALFRKITLGTTFMIPVAGHDESQCVCIHSASFGLACYEVSVVVYCRFVRVFLDYNCPNFNGLDWGWLRITCTIVSSLDICLAFAVECCDLCNVKSDPMFVSFSRILCDLRRLLFDHEPFLHLCHNNNAEQIISTL